MKEISFRNDILPLKNELYRLALRITQNSAEAEDTVQETMLKMWNRRDTWGEIENVETLCLTICRNLSLDKLRRKGSRHESVDDAPGDYRADASQNPERRAELRDRVAVVRRLVDGLPEKQRCVMQLRDFEGKSYKEVAAALGISEEQVKVNLFRARQTIKRKFQEADSYGL